MVIPSIYEPFGMVALEAAAAGAPIAAAATGGLSEIVESGVTGVRFPAGDPRGLADAVGGLLSDEKLARRLAKQARSMVEQRYSWTSVAARTAAVYSGALREAPGYEARQAATALANGRPRVVVPEGNLLAAAAP
jgi:glycogen(starch) synthase